MQCDYISLVTLLRISYKLSLSVYTHTYMEVKNDREISLFVLFLDLLESFQEHFYQIGIFSEYLNIYKLFTFSKITDK